MPIAAEPSLKVGAASTDTKGAAQATEVCSEKKQVVTVGLCDESDFNSTAGEETPALGTPEFEEWSRSLDRRPLAYRAAKRAFDVAFSLAVIAACLLLWPVTLALLAVIAIQTRAFPLYTQERVGRYGKTFRVVKLRTMVGDSDDVGKYLDAEQLAQWHAERKVDGDPRIVPVGRFLRKTSLDEFANVANVLAGQLSVIGPRLVSAEEMAWYGPGEAARLLSVPQGITGWWQCTSRNGATFESGERQALELHYVDNAGPAMDWRVFKGTFGVMFGKERTGR